MIAKTSPACAQVGVYVMHAEFSSAAVVSLQLRSPEKGEPTVVTPLASCLVATILEAASGAASACGGTNNAQRCGAYSRL